MRIATLLLMSLAAGACGLEGEIFTPLTDRGHVLLPGAQDTVLTGRVDVALAGATTRAIRADGESLGGTTSVSDDQGVFSIRFPGVLSARGALVVAERGAQTVFGLVPELPAQPSVFHEERWIALAEVHPVLAELGVESSTVALLVLRAAHLNGVAVGALSGDAILDAMDQALALMATPGSSGAMVATAVATIQQAASATTQGDSPWDLQSLSGGSVLRAEWLANELVDLDGDGVQDADSAKLDEALDEAAAELNLSVCYVPDRIKVVFQVELGADLKDGNCATLDPYKWAADTPASRVFFTGGVHSDSPICGEDGQEGCLQTDEIEPTDQLLGAWEPNLVPMWDDGTHGDGVAGDGIWTFEVELPYWDPSTSASGAGLRIGYKYTLGMPGQGWTSTEEWPGNKRILEIVDRNSDGIVVRRDAFGDEASNKDKANALKPSAGGCGTNAWASEPVAGCGADTEERMVDTDGDCLADSWPDPGPVVPLIQACDDAG